MKKSLPFLALCACLAAFAFGLVELFELRFETGDVYPEYSSLRADPLGTMALYESLGQIPGITTRRDFSTANRLPEEPRTVYLHVAAERDEFDWVPPELFHELKNFLARGDRLVIAYFPQTEKNSFRLFEAETKTNTDQTITGKTNSYKPAPGKSVKPKKLTAHGETDISLPDEWDFHLGFRTLFPQGQSYEPVRVENQTELPLPAKLEWHSGMIFTNCAPQWKTIYARGTNAVVLERQFGKGTVVLASDSYFVSNEAMSKDRHADMLAWLIGPNKNVVFDEAHLGTTDSSGVAKLMWKYHLQALMAGLLLLAGLYIWKNSSSLVPASADNRPNKIIAGKDAASGFVNLLRRNIAPRDLLVTGFAEWKKSHVTGGAISAARRQAAEQILQAENALPEKDRRPLAAYQKITETLKIK